MDLDGATTDFAVFDVLLFGDRAVDKQSEWLTAIGASDGVFFEWMNHGGPPNSGTDHGPIVAQLDGENQWLKRKR
jgi:hypothetical protein